MYAGDTSSLPNPFAVELSSTRRGGRKAVVSALKFLLVAAAALAVVLVIGSQSRGWLLSRLTHDFDSLSRPQKQQRLVQIAEFGQPAIPVLVRTLADSDPSVARTSYELLRKAQNDWTLLERSEAMSHHRAMIEAIRGVAGELPNDRTGWTTALLQQSILEAVEGTGEASRHLHAAATDALAELSLTKPEEPRSPVGRDHRDPLSETTPGAENAPRSPFPVRVSARAEPLPVTTHSIDQWTNWPPSRQRSTRSATSPTDRNLPPQPAAESPAAESREAGSEESLKPSVQPQQAPSIYRSSASQEPAVRLRPVASDRTVTLQEIEPPPQETGSQATSQSAAALVDSPLQTLDTRSVVHWLGSPQRARRDQARTELRRRGLDENQLLIASRIARGDVQTRLELVESLAHSDSLDPRPWLLMLMDDRSRDVKLRVLSVLATMRDPAITKELRDRVAGERDPTVAARLRKVLDLR